MDFLNNILTLSEIDRFLWKDVKHAHTTRAAVAFTKKFIFFFGSLSEDELIDLAEQLKIKSEYVDIVFRVAFVLTYIQLREESGNMLPLTSKGDYIMGSIRQAEEVSNIQTPFASAETLAKSNTTFCVEEVRLGQTKDIATQKMRDTWFLTLLLGEEDLPKHENLDGRVTVTITSYAGSKRDKMFKHLSGLVPGHNGYFSITKLDKVRKSIELKERDVSQESNGILVCACGSLIGLEDDNGEVVESDHDAFLDLDSNSPF